MVERYTFLSRTFFVTLWVTLCWGFIVSDVLPPLDKLRPAFRLITDLIFMALSLSVIRKRSDIMLIVAFILISLASEYLNSTGLITYFNGFREFLGLLFSVPLLRYFLTSEYADKFRESFDRQLYVFLWLQVPCIAIQFLIYGACDHVGGSLGNLNSGTISTLIYCISFYLMNRRWDTEKPYIQNLKDNRVLIFLLFPSFLNETKVSFIYLILYFILLLSIDRKFIIRVVFVSPIALILALGAGYVYVMTVGDEADNFSVEYFNDYLVGEDIDELIDIAQMIEEEDIDPDDQNVMDLPRFGRWIAVPEALQTTKGGLMLGAGIGIFKGGSVLARTRFSIDYNWLLQGSVTMAFFIFMQLGILGSIWILWTFAMAILGHSNSVRGSNIKLYLVLVTLVTFVYSSFFRDANICFVFFYLALSTYYLDRDIESGQTKKDISYVKE